MWNNKHYYYSIRITNMWRIRISIEHMLDIALELFQSPHDDWHGLYINLCNICLEFKTVRGFHKC